MFCVGFLKRVRYVQYLSAIIGAFAATCNGIHSSWASPSLPKLTSGESPIGTQVTNEEASWIASTLPLGILCSGLIKAVRPEFIGRRIWMLVSGAFLTAPWLIIGFSKSFTLLCVARFIGGIGFGFAIQTVPVYIAEITEKDIRGKMIITMGILQISGNLLVFAIGPFVSYTTLATICGTPPIILLVLLYFVPESPHYLLMTGKRNEAYNVLRQLSSKIADDTYVKNRLTEIEEAVQYNMKNKSNVWECISKNTYRRSMLLLIGVKTLQQLSGFYGIEPYAQTIIMQAKSSISPEISSILFGLVQLPAVTLASLLVDRLGRRPLWIVSAAGCCISLIGLGLYFYLEEESLNWMPTTCVLLYFIMCNLGVVFLPILVCAEIFPTNIRSVAVSISVVYNSSLHFVVVKSFEPITANLGNYVAFWGFAVVCLLGTYFIFFVMPETKGKTLEELQTILYPDKKRETFQVTTK